MQRKKNCRHPLRHFSRRCRAGTAGSGAQGAAGAQAGPDMGQAQQQAAPEDDVVDGDFREV